MLPKIYYFGLVLSQPKERIKPCCNPCLAPLSVFAIRLKARSRTEFRGRGGQARTWRGRANRDRFIMTWPGRQPEKGPVYIGLRVALICCTVSKLARCGLRPKPAMYLSSVSATVV